MPFLAYSAYLPPGRTLGIPGPCLQCLFLSYAWDPALSHHAGLPAQGTQGPATWGLTEATSATGSQRDCRLTAVPATCHLCLLCRSHFHEPHLCCLPSAWDLRTLTRFSMLRPLPRAHIHLLSSEEGPACLYLPLEAWGGTACSSSPPCRDLLPAITCILSLGLLHTHYHSYYRAAFYAFSVATYLYHPPPHLFSTIPSCVHRISHYTTWDHWDSAYLHCHHLCILLWVCKPF